MKGTDTEQRENLDLQRWVCSQEENEGLIMTSEITHSSLLEHSKEEMDMGKNCLPLTVRTNRKSLTFGNEI